MHILFHVQFTSITVRQCRMVQNINTYTELFVVYTHTVYDSMRHKQTMCKMFKQFTFNFTCARLHLQSDISLFIFFVTLDTYRHLKTKTQEGSNLYKQYLYYVGFRYIYLEILSKIVSQNRKFEEYLYRSIKRFAVTLNNISIETKVS